MSKFSLIVNNSYCTIKGGIPQDTENLIHRILTTHNDIEAEVASIFYRMKMLKQFGLKYKKDETKEENATRVRQSMHVNQAQLKKLQDSEYVYWYQNRQFPTGHVNIVKDLLDSLKVDYELIDKRKRIQPHLSLPWKSKPFDPRYYQSEMIKLGLKEGRGVFASAVGTGKTLIMEYLIKEIAVISLIIVPSKGLKVQNYNELASAFGTVNVQKIEAVQIRKGAKLKPIRVVTIQTIAALMKSGDLDLLIKDVEALYVDEIHHSGSASYTNLIPHIGHVYWKFGFTGTFMRNDSKSLDMWGFLSTLLYKYSASKAIEDGYLTPIDYSVYPLKGKSGGRYPKEYDNNYCGSPEILRAVSGIINGVGPDEQILILVNRKDKAGAIFHEMLNAQDIDNTYISGDDDEETISQSIKDFNSKKINVLIGSGVIGEGIDICSTDHLILAQGGKSEIVICQAVGRLVRLFKGKKIGHLYDFDFKGTKYMAKHLIIRRDIIERNFQPREVIEI